MFGQVKWRVWALTLALGALVTGIGWTAHTAWRQVEELSDRLTAVQLESFRIADHFQQTIPRLNHTLLHYMIERDKASWDRFITDGTTLDQWIDDQMPRLTSQHERDILQKLNGVYDAYRSRAHQLQEATTTSEKSPTWRREFDGFERTTEEMLNLGYELAEAHRAALDEFLRESNRSLGHLRWLLIGSLVALFGFGAALAMVVYRDMISPLRRKLVESTQLLEQKEKFAALGLLASGVAHEIRNPLTAIKARLFTQQKLLSPGSPERVDAEVIGQEINRLERIVKDFLQFARPADPRLETVPASQPLREVATLLGPQLENQSIQVTLALDIDPPVRLDPQQMKQVLINLVQNAAESIGNGGHITLRTRRDTLRLRGRQQPVVLLEVQDNGKGIPADVQKRLFDPFFTTKETGTGLGLPIAARIVEKHGGLLEYQTEAGRGTVFGVALPLEENP
ncbi:MAG TPA: ATP-binding protein [Roseimicrobium sp.]|nr:ATP-binding protein [Roseimicrobium sp.]